MHLNPRIALLCALLVVVSTTTLADTLIGKVVAVADGDTITVLDSQQTQHKVRLMGIDSPEKSQPFGQNAKQSLSDLVFGHSVNVEWQKLDRYERIVGKVMVNGQDANLEQVRRGLAWLGTSRNMTASRSHSNGRPIPRPRSRPGWVTADSGLIRNLWHLGIGAKARKTEMKTSAIHVSVTLIGAPRRE
jgi:endonuclease YncB( thermonuclease family)